VSQKRDGQGAKAVLVQQEERWVYRGCGAWWADEHKFISVDVIADGDLWEVGVFGAGQSHRSLGLRQGNADWLGAGDCGVEAPGEHDCSGVVDGVGHRDHHRDRR
jgi:hypothetical protein